MIHFVVKHIRHQIRKSLIRFLNDDFEEAYKEVYPEEEGDEKEDKSEHSAAHQLQVEEALRGMDMQAPIYITKDIDDKLFEDVISKLHDILYLRSRVKELRTTYPDDKMLGLIDLDKPIKVIVSTVGGRLRESLALYDAIQLLKEDGAVIETVGTGQVMSAGTLLLSAGTIGHRYITKNTTVMVHDVAGGSIGTYHEMENRFEEVTRLREQFFKVFRKNTKITGKQLRTMLDKKLDQYMDADTSLKYGIVDEII